MHLNQCIKVASFLVFQKNSRSVTGKLFLSIENVFHGIIPSTAFELNGKVIFNNISLLDFLMVNVFFLSVLSSMKYSDVSYF